MPTSPPATWTPPTGKNILSILQSLAHQDGYCVILVTHDEGIGRRADQLIYLVDGLLQTGGTAGEWNRFPRLRRAGGLALDGREEGVLR